MNLGMLLFMPASIAGEQIILIDTSTERDGQPAREVTYGELLENVSKAAGLLTTLGVLAGDRVGVFATNSAECVEAIFGAAFVGATVVPMNFRAGAEEAAHDVRQRDQGLFSESRYSDLVSDNRPDSLEHVFMLDDAGSYHQARDESLNCLPGRCDQMASAHFFIPAAQLLPKGVKLTNGALTDM